MLPAGWGVWGWGCGGLHPAAPLEWFLVARGTSLALGAHPSPIPGPSTLALPPWLLSLCRVYQALQRFTVLDLSNFYLDVAKDRLVRTLCPAGWPAGGCSAFTGQSHVRLGNFSVHGACSAHALPTNLEANRRRPLAPLPFAVHLRPWLARPASLPDRAGRAAGGHAAADCAAAAAHGGGCVAEPAVQTAAAVRCVTCVSVALRQQQQS